MARYSSVEERKQRANDLKNSRNYRYAYNNRRIKTKTRGKR